MRRWEVKQDHCAVNKEKSKNKYPVQYRTASVRYQDKHRRCWLFQPRVGAQRLPWYCKGKYNTTLIALRTCACRPLPTLSALLKLVKIFPGLSLRSNPGLKLANASGPVITTQNVNFTANWTCRGSPTPERRNPSKLKSAGVLSGLTLFALLKVLNISIIGINA